MTSRPNYKKMYEHENTKRLEEMYEYENAVQEYEGSLLRIKEALAASQNRNTELHRELQETRQALKDAQQQVIASGRDVSQMSSKLIRVRTTLAYVTKALDELNEGDKHRGE